MTFHNLNPNQLRIALRRTKPPIWRRVLVPPSMYLDTLHHLIQVVMGWEDRHLHMFRKGDRRYSMPGPWDNDWRSRQRPGISTRGNTGSASSWSAKKDWMTYMYDFGDSWEHKVTLQKILPYDRTVRLPACTGGRRRCPPEDCGGVWGYYEMLEVLKDPNARDHEHMKEWIGEDFDPEVFSAQAVDEVLGEGVVGGGWPGGRGGCDPRRMQLGYRSEGDQLRGENVKCGLHFDKWGLPLVS